MIISSFYPVVGGAQRQTQRESRSLIARGWSVQVLTRRHTPYLNTRGLSRTDVVDGISLTRLYSRGSLKIGALLYMLNGLWHLLRRGRRGLYHARDVGAQGWLAVIARHLLRGRCIVTLYSGRAGYEERLSSGLARWQFRRLLRLADKVVVVSSEVEEMVRELGVPERRVVQISNSIDTSYFRPAQPEEKVASRKVLQLPPDKVIALCVGRLEAVKGLDILLQAWAMLPATQRDGALLVMVGDGRQRDVLLSMTQSMGLQQSVMFAGEQRAVRDYYWAADAFLLPSRTEGLSLSLIEAMACGLPAVASDVGGALDVVENDENGLLFKSEDQVELVERLVLMMKMAHRWPQMGARARQTATDYADLGATVRRWGDLYRELA